MKLSHRPLRCQGTEPGCGLPAIGRYGARRATSRALAILLGGLLLGAQPARATTVVAKDLHALCAEADLIFVGTVRDVRSQWTGAERQSIETLVTFSDLTPVLGVEAGEVMLRFAGGTVDDTREEFAGVPRFTVGERVVVFARNERSISPVVGFHQGCFRVVDAPSGAVVLDVNRRPPPDAVGGALGVASDTAGESSVPLDVFLTRIRQELGARPERRP